MGRAPCCDKANVKKGPWSPEEDAKLKSYIEQEGTGGNWIALPQKIGLKRCGKSCRLRWLNYLRPNIKHGGFSEEEDHIICSLYIAIGSRWSIIAAQLPGRTDNDIKNYWNTRLKKKLLGSKQRKNNQHGRRSKQEAKRAMEGVGEASVGIQQTQWHEPMVPNSQIENNGVYSHAMIRKVLTKLASEHSMIHQQALGHSVDPLIAPSVHTNSFTQGFSAMSGQIGHAPDVVPDELSEVLYCNMTKLEGLDCLYGVGGMVHDSTATSASESLSWSEECALLYPSVASTYQVMQKHSFSDHEQMNLEAQ